MLVQVSGAAVTKIFVGLPIPDEYFGTTLFVPTSSVEDAAVTLAVFASKVDAIDEVIRKAIADGNGPAASVKSALKPDGRVRSAGSITRRLSY